MGAWQYDDQDLERLGMVMTLHGIGFDSSEVETYMRLMLEGEDTQPQRIAMLNKKRGKLLDEIHFKEKQISSMITCGMKCRRVISNCKNFIYCHILCNAIFFSGLRQ